MARGIREGDSHSDDSSAVAVVESTDQATADVPCLANLMATSDFTQYHDPHANGRSKPWELAPLRPG